MSEKKTKTELRFDQDIVSAEAIWDAAASLCVAMAKTKQRGLDVRVSFSDRDNSRVKVDVRRPFKSGRLDLIFNQTVGIPS